MKRGNQLILFFGICILCLSGCAKSLPQMQVNYSAEWMKAAKQWPDKELEKRFAEYWALRFQGPLETAFEMEAPHFQELIGLTRYSSLLKEFLNQKLMDIVVRDIVKETDYSLVVDCMQKVRLSNGEIKELYCRDNWVKVKDSWYHFYRDPMLFPMAM